MMARAAPKAGLGRSGFVDDARRAATPHVIDCNGLSRENLGHQPYRFECELRERTAWCKENSGLCEIEPLRDEKTKVLTGYRFRFEKLVDAVFFKLRFDTQI